MNGQWVSVASRLPNDGMVVGTKISDENGTRNEADLMRRGSLWFVPDGSMYVYYQPTHWWEWIGCCRRRHPHPDRREVVSLTPDMMNKFELQEKLTEAQDTITTLRAELTDARDIALEEAAQTVEGFSWNTKNEIVAAIRALKGLQIPDPDQPGGYVGDIWFGNPIKGNLGTHAWDGIKWNRLKSESECLTMLLAEARAEATTRPALESEGWVLVPVEPTEAMLSAMARHNADWLSDKGPYPRSRRVYSAMLSARPKAPHTPASEG